MSSCVVKFGGPIMKVLVVVWAVVGVAILVPIPVMDRRPIMMTKIVFFIFFSLSYGLYVDYTLDLYRCFVGFFGHSDKNRGFFYPLDKRLNVSNALPGFEEFFSWLLNRAKNSISWAERIPWVPVPSKR